MVSAALINVVPLALIKYFIAMDAFTHTIEQYELLTDWYLNSLEGIEDKDGSKSLNGFTNSLEWIAAHLLVERHKLINLLEGEIEPYAYYDKLVDPTAPPPHNRAFNVDTKYQPLSEIRSKWIGYSTVFIAALKKADVSILSKTLPSNSLTGGNKAENLLVFLAVHEGYHIGQMSLMRKALGYGGMKLGRR